MRRPVISLVIAAALLFTSSAYATDSHFLGEKNPTTNDYLSSVVNLWGSKTTHKNPQQMNWQYMLLKGAVLYTMGQLNLEDIRGSATYREIDKAYDILHLDGAQTNNTSVDGVGKEDKTILRAFNTLGNQFPKAFNGDFSSSTKPYQVYEVSKKKSYILMALYKAMGVNYYTPPVIVSTPLLPDRDNPTVPLLKTPFFKDVESSLNRDIVQFNNGGGRLLVFSDFNNVEAYVNRAYNDNLIKESDINSKFKERLRLISDSNKNTNILDKRVFIDKNPKNLMSEQPARNTEVTREKQDNFTWFYVLTRNGIQINPALQAMEEEDNGYTYAQLLTLAADIMYLSGEPILNEEELLAVEQAVSGANLDSYTQDLSDALKFLIGKGIIPLSIDNNRLNSRATDNDVYDIILRIADKGSRHANKINVTRLEKSMVSQGYRVHQATHNDTGIVNVTQSIPKTSLKYLNYFIETDKLPKGAGKLYVVDSKKFDETKLNEQEPTGDPKTVEGFDKNKISPVGTLGQEIDLSLIKFTPITIPMTENIDKVVITTLKKGDPYVEFDLTNSGFDTKFKEEQVKDFAQDFPNWVNTPKVFSNRNNEESVLPSISKFAKPIKSVEGVNTHYVFKFEKGKEKQLKDLAYRIETHMAYQKKGKDIRAYAYYTWKDLTVDPKEVHALIASQFDEFPKDAPVDVQFLMNIYEDHLKESSSDTTDTTESQKNVLAEPGKELQEQTVKPPPVFTKPIPGLKEEKIMIPSKIIRENYKISIDGPSNGKMTLTNELGQSAFIDNNTNTVVMGSTIIKFNDIGSKKSGEVFIGEGDDLVVDARAVASLLTSYSIAYLNGGNINFSISTKAPQTGILTQFTDHNFYTSVRTKKIGKDVFIDLNTINAIQSPVVAYRTTAKPGVISYSLLRNTCLNKAKGAQDSVSKNFKSFMGFEMSDPIIKLFDVAGQSAISVTYNQRDNGVWFKVKEKKDYLTQPTTIPIFYDEEAAKLAEDTKTHFIVDNRMCVEAGTGGDVKNQPVTKVGSSWNIVDPAKDVLPLKTRWQSGQISKVIYVDPGHGVKREYGLEQEYISPYTEDGQKDKSKDGMTEKCTGTGIREAQMTLDLAKEVRKELSAKGYIVKMSRENNETNISNKERAEAAANLGADLHIRLHYNSDKTMNGPSAMAQQPDPVRFPKRKEIDVLSSKYKDLLCEEVANAMGMQCQSNSWDPKTYTGNNWAAVPGALIEVLELEYPADNPESCKAFKDPDHYKKVAKGIARSVDRYYAEVLNKPQVSSPTQVGTYYTWLPKIMSYNYNYPYMMSKDKPSNCFKFEKDSDLFKKCKETYVYNQFTLEEKAQSNVFKTLKRYPTPQLKIMVENINQRVIGREVEVGSLLAVGSILYNVHEDRTLTKYIVTGQSAMSKYASKANTLLGNPNKAFYEELGLYIKATGIKAFEFTKDKIQIPILKDDAELLLLSSNYNGKKLYILKEEVATVDVGSLDKGPDQFQVFAESVKDLLLGKGNEADAILRSVEYTADKMLYWIFFIIMDIIPRIMMASLLSLGALSMMAKNPVMQNLMAKFDIAYIVSFGLLRFRDLDPVKSWLYTFVGSVLIVVIHRNALFMLIDKILGI